LNHGLKDIISSYSTYIRQMFYINIWKKIHKRNIYHDFSYKREFQNKSNSTFFFLRLFFVEMHETRSRGQITLLTDEVTRLWSKGCQLTSRIHPKWPFILRTIFPVRRSYTANKKEKGKSAFAYMMVSHIKRSRVSKLTDEPTRWISRANVSLTGAVRRRKATTYQSLTNRMTVICHDTGITL